MSFYTPVNAFEPTTQDTWCVPMMAIYGVDHFILSRCTAIISERYDCLEFTSSFDSLSIIEAFDDPGAAFATFEFMFERAPTIHQLNRKPMPFDNVRTVSIRDICEGESA